MEDPIKTTDEKNDQLDAESFSTAPDDMGKTNPDPSELPSSAELERRRLPAVADLTDASTIEVNVARGDVFKVTLGGNRTLGNPKNVTGDQKRIEFIIKQDGTGGRTLAYDTKYRFSSGLPSPTITTTISHWDRLLFAYDKSADKWDLIGYIPDFS
jgi:hypothetical protein